MEKYQHKLLAKFICFATFSIFFAFGPNIAHAENATESFNPGYYKATQAVNIRSCPGTSCARVFLYYTNSVTKNVRKELTQVHSGQIFWMKEARKATNGVTWYQIDMNITKLRFPERIHDEWWVSGDYFKPASFDRIDPDQDSIKEIRINKATQTWYAKEGNKLIKSGKVSTGKPGMDTPSGTYNVTGKFPVKNMEGPIPGYAKDEYLVEVPNALLLRDGYHIHPEYWHSNLGHAVSHGCINVSMSDGEWLYNWATLGTRVVVK